VAQIDFLAVRRRAWLDDMFARDPRAVTRL
jgi:hypothetical protein